MLDQERLGALELDLVKDFLVESMDQAAVSMGQMLHIRVKANLINFGEGQITPIAAFDQLGKFRAHVMKVALNGPIGGAFYFIINWHEVELINRVCMPDSINPATHSENRQMKIGIISEIENTIAAQSVSRISDFLGVQLLGGVPEMDTMEGERINEYLVEELYANKASFYAQSVLNGVAVDISPYFVWMLDDNFSKTLKLNTVS
jgi:chemotaxis protein CheY-P-specific phosphatase CheC